jgi:hypothetical protein
MTQERGPLRPPVLSWSLSLNELSRQLVSPLSTVFSDHISPSSFSHLSSTIENERLCISIPLNDALKNIVEERVEERVVVAVALEADIASVRTGMNGSRQRVNGLGKKRQGAAKEVQRLTTLDN